ncbi:hypothetical protein HOU41_gp137 [Proteus phage Stubb]|uniref:Uncharacterized protein n=1 Tax=Proteus phage Stubb TaxID=2315597 RepID=A0A3B8DX55_9CAUD|nr:hypothetical protein HOU41_gp137 [Proteus phage Stubb]AYJ73207.1 hypothetical protein CPT_Stubb_079 [Proteus phage Stubb]
MQNNKFLVLSNSDIVSALSEDDLVILNHLIDKIKSFRRSVGKNEVRKYLVVSEKDTELFEIVKDTILEYYK